MRINKSSQIVNDTNFSFIIGTEIRNASPFTKNLIQLNRDDEKLNLYEFFH